MAYRVQREEAIEVIQAHMAGLVVERFGARKG
jgi:hypothetical protein